MGLSSFRLESTAKFVLLLAAKARLPHSPRPPSLGHQRPRTARLRSNTQTLLGTIRGELPALGPNSSLPPLASTWKGSRQAGVAIAAGELEYKPDPSRIARPSWPLLSGLTFAQVLLYCPDRRTVLR